MKGILPTTMAVFILLSRVSLAIAQTVVISPEQETVIREYVTTQDVQPAEIPSGVTIEVGATLPEAVELHTIDAPDVDLQYRYVVADNRTFLVEPETRKIIHVIE